MAATTSSFNWPATGMGTLGLTWRATVTPDEQAFAALKAAVDNGATIFSSAWGYGPPGDPSAGLRLLRRYFERYPEDAPKVTLFIRGCLSPVMGPVTSREEVRASVAECNGILAGAKKIDIFGPARIAKTVPVEETVGALKELVEEGQIGAVGLSEVSAETIRRACAVCPIAAVEEEFSLWSTEILTNGVADVCRENGVAIWAYAPLGYGILTGQIKKVEDIPAGDLRHMIGRFQGDNFAKNLDLVDKVKEFATKRGVTPGQLALAWIRAHSNKGNCGTIIPIPGATAASRVEENCKAVTLSDGEKEELDKILKSITVAGHRQIPELPDNIWT